MKINEIGKPAGGGSRPARRRGRGGASGRGGTSGRGHKGQNARSGGGVRPGFEGGQMPLSRRLPKRGFTSRAKLRLDLKVFNLDRLSALSPEGVIDQSFLQEKGLVRKGQKIKILSRGEISGPLKVHAHYFSRAARAKIEKAGGEAVEIKNA